MSPPLIITPRRDRPAGRHHRRRARRGRAGAAGADGGGLTARRWPRCRRPPTGSLRASVYEELRQRFVTGKIAPGVGLSTRGLALEIGVSQMPVRDALSRLAAEGAVAIRSKRRIEVPAMTAERFADLLRLPALLEPEAAVLALPHITPRG